MIRYILIFIFTLVASINMYAKDTMADYSFDNEILNVVSVSGDKKMESFSVLIENSKTSPKASYYCGVALQYFMNELSDAEKLYKRAVQLYQEQNNTKEIVLPLHNLGMLMVDSNKTIQGYQYLQKASDLGYERSTYNLAYLLGRSDDYYTNYALKIRVIGLYKKLLDSDKYRPEALLSLGLLLMNPPNGHNNELIDYNQSLIYLLEAANKYKLVEAYHALGTLYSHSESKFKDKKKGTHWFIKAHSDRLNKELSIFK